MSQEISLNGLRYDMAVGLLERNAGRLASGGATLPELKGSSPAQEAFVGQIGRLQGLLASYQRALSSDVQAYRRIATVMGGRIATVMGEADEKSARTLVEALEAKR